MSTKRQPIAIFHALYEVIGDREFPCYDMQDVEMHVHIRRNVLKDFIERHGFATPRFYIEWLDTTTTEVRDESKLSAMRKTRLQ